MQFSAKVTYKTSILAILLRQHMCTFHEDPPSGFSFLKSFTYQMCVCLVVRIFWSAKKSLIASSPPFFFCQFKEFPNLIWREQSTERPQVCTIDLSGYDNLWNIGRGKGRNCRRETKIFRQANSRSIWTVQSFIFNIDVESYLALSVTNLKASFVHHYSPKHTISQKFSFYHNLWQKMAKC